MLDYKHIADTAVHLGFNAVGAVEAKPVDSENANRFMQWLTDRHNAGMNYMERNIGIRLDIQQWFEKAKSVIVLLWQYTPNIWQDKHLPQISCFAYGEDYHRFIKKKLKQFLRILQQEYPSLEGRYAVDTSPILERYLAVQAGLGFIGNNGMLINETLGSFVFIAVLAVSDTINYYDSPLTQSRCNNCMMCIKSCPNNAIQENRTIDARRCISYLTIEYPRCETKEMPFRNRSNYIFGCDICQRCCPYNKHCTVKSHSENSINHSLLQMNASDWLSINETDFMRLTQHSPLKRAGRSGIRYNLGA